jgi:hypothetical protein
MAWIKRNLYFVITLAVGVILIGVAGYFAYAAIGANADARDQYTSALNDLTTLEAKKPFPSPENIKIANDDSARVAEVVKSLGTAFVNFPTPPAVDPREFITYLNTNLDHFRTEATNANVQLIAPDYAFSFSPQVHALSFSQNSFGPWMEQLEEIKGIVDVLCAAKINSLDSLQRAPAPGEDANGPDFLQGAVTSNQVAVISPYKISFRGFSEEIANVLKGFAKSPHCFLIKNIVVSPSKAVPLGSVSPQMAPQMQYVPVQRPRPGMGEGGRRRRGGEGFMPEQPQMEMVAVAAPTTPSGPVTILKPLPLFVTMDVNVVQLKNSQR